MKPCLWRGTPWECLAGLRVAASQGQSVGAGCQWRGANVCSSQAWALGDLFCAWTIQRQGKERVPNFYLLISLLLKWIQFCYVHEFSKKERNMSTVHRDPTFGMILDPKDSCMSQAGPFPRGDALTAAPRICNFYREGLGQIMTKMEMGGLSWCFRSKGRVGLETDKQMVGWFVGEILLLSVVQLFVSVLLVGLKSYPLLQELTEIALSKFCRHETPGTGRSKFYHQAPSRCSRSHSSENFWVCPLLRFEDGMTVLHWAAKHGNCEAPERSEVSLSLPVIHQNSLRPQKVSGMYLFGTRHPNSSKLLSISFIFPHFPA